MHPLFHWLPINFVVGTNDSELSSFAFLIYCLFCNSSSLQKGDTFICILLLPELATLSLSVCVSEVTSRTGCYCPKCCLHTL